MLYAILAAFGLPGAWAEVDPAAPVDGPPVSGVIPPLPGVLPFFEPPAFETTPFLLHEGKFTFVADAAGVPAPGFSCAALPANPSGTSASAAFPGVVAAALAEADASVSQLDGGSIADFFQVFKTAVEGLGGNVTTSILPTLQQCFSPAPAQARWLRSQRVPREVYWMPGQAEFSYSYDSEPVSLQEIRLRAARLYCAARTAQFQQSSVSSMGERIGFSVKILGRQIDFLVTEPTLALDGPERFTGLGANDGAQAFEIPLLLGTRITPIRGLGLPGFRETRVPVSIVVGDTEVRTAADLRSVRTGTWIQCSFSTGCYFVPQFETMHAKSYQTVTHLARIRSASKDTSVFGETEIFRVGPLAVDLGFKIDYLLGQLESDNRRVIDLPGFPPARSGRLWISPQSGTRRHDGPWGLEFFGPPIGDFLPGVPTWVVRADGQTDPFWREPLNLVAPPPLDVRLLHDDDHALDTATGLGIAGLLSGELGGSFGPFTISLKVTGEISGEVSQHHVLRDALIAEDFGAAVMTPATALRVRPRQTAKAELKPASGTIRFFLELFFPFDDIDFTKTLFSAPAVTLAQYDSDTATVASDEKLVFQLGTGSAQGSVTDQPDARSHFPGGQDFASFPVDVATCLADPQKNPPTPPYCKPTLTPGKTPSAEVCIYGPNPDTEELVGSLPPNVCDDLDAYIAGLGVDPAHGDCLTRFLGLLCSPVSKQQIYNGLSVVAHVFDLANDSEGEAFGELLQVCAAAFDTPAPGDPIDTSHWSEQLVNVALCTEDGTLIDPNEIMTVVGDPTKPPPVVQGPPCN